jgi:hypothetical protein
MAPIEQPPSSPNCCNRHPGWVTATQNIAGHGEQEQKNEHIFRKHSSGTECDT